MSDHIEGEDVSALLDGALEAPARARAEAHLAACSGCRLELASWRRLKHLLACAPRKTMPADLALALESRLVDRRSWRSLAARTTFWIPAGALAATALMVGLWLQRSRAAGELPLEPLLAAHARYSADALLPDEQLVASTYSDQMGALYANAPDAEPR